MNDHEIAVKITEAELEVIRVLWESEKPLNITELKDILCQKEHWSGDTVKTLLRRLCAKGAVGQEKRRVFYYYPLISAETYDKYALQRVIDKLYSGSAQQLVVALFQNEQLSLADMEELRALFRGKDGEK